MWKRLWERLLSGFGILLMGGWFVCAILITIWVVQIAGVEARPKGFAGLALMIFLVPIGIVVAVDEFVIRRIKYGPPAPGRRRRGHLNPEELLSLDERLKRRPRDTSES